MKLNFEEEYILKNDILELKPLTEGHFKELLEFSINEPETWNFSLIKANNEINLKNYIDIALKDKKEGKSYPFAVYDKRLNKFCGSTRFYNIDIVNKCLSIGYTWYGKDFRGTGINKNCKFLLLEFAFEKLKMERVEFRADKENIISIKAMKSIGCKEEGILRSNMFKPDGTRRDSIVLSILKTEWYSDVKETLKTKTTYNRV